MSAGHAKLPPSGAKIWLNCGGSVKLCASVVDTGSIYSDTGSAGHEVFRSGAAGETKPKDWIERVVKVETREVEITEELVEHVITALEFVEDFREKYPGADIRLERKYEIGESFGIKPGILWGTADFSAVLPFDGKLVIADLKLGFVEVDVEDNEQLTLYGYGLAAEQAGTDWDEIELVILQPKKDLAPKTITYTRSEFNAFFGDMGQGVNQALSENAPLNVGEWCRFCKANGSCPELRKEMLAIANREFSSLYTMSGPELGELLTKGKMIEGAMRSMRNHAIKLLEIDPNYIPGWKRVQGEKRRRWKDKEAALVELKGIKVEGRKLKEDDYAPRELTSPLQVETLIAAGIYEAHKGSKPKVTKKIASQLAREVIEDLIEKPPGDSTLVPEDDRREALAPIFTEAEVAQLEADTQAAKGDQPIEPIHVLTEAEEMLD